HLSRPSSTCSLIVPCYPNGALFSQTAGLFRISKSRMAEPTGFWPLSCEVQTEYKSTAPRMTTYQYLLLLSLHLCLHLQEEQNRGKPNWEHLNEDLHVLITVEDAQNRADIKLKRAVDEVTKLLVPAAEGEDSLKKMQLMELAILNGTYRDANIKPSSLAFSLAASTQTSRVLTGPAPVLAPPTTLRTPAPTGPTLMPLIRQIQTVLPNGTPALMPGAGPESSLIYTAPYDYPYALAAPASILEYPLDSGGVLGVVAAKIRRHELHVRPYRRMLIAGRG
uniref:QKI, KH domain containing RNA binding n=1 Tax=Amphilophus citrinellus TaxID=61819 RepID=A0A3Q0R517_AMPCI